MIVNYPSRLAKIDRDVLVVKSMRDDTEVRAVRLLIPEGVIINLTTYGLDINGQNSDAVAIFGKRLINSVAQFYPSNT